MLTIEQTLRNSDGAIFPILARVWGVKLDHLKSDEIIKVLGDAMLIGGRVEGVWDTLDDQQRGGLQMLIASGGKMPTAKFRLLYGEIRKMGKGQLEREKPLEKPANIAEALFYRGLISESFENSETGLRGIMYTPPDLAALLPVHKTAYVNLQDEEGDVEAEDENLEDDEADTLPTLEDVGNPRPTDTSIVDDMTTLLAYLQLQSAAIHEDRLSPDEAQHILPYLLKPDVARVDFLLGVGVSADLISLENGQAFPKRAEARKWLSAPRWEQVKILAEGWRKSGFYQDLWYVPGLHPEPTGWPYDPNVGRNALISFIAEFAPQTAWWPVDEFIEMVKETEPDFQRPGGDYDSWYIRNNAGEYLHGFESWEAVEGALLEFYLFGPMHWLGLMDVADEAARLTAYGRAFVGGAKWPTPADTEEKVVVKPDGTLLASRKVPRVDRFQLARFTTWMQSGDPYVYKLDAQGIQQAAAQSINTGHIASFLNRMLDGAPMPSPIAKLLETWQGGALNNVTFERLLVLRTHAPEIMDTVYNNPTLRRYLGARLGPMACIIRAGQQDAFQDALALEGIGVEMIE